MFYAIGGTKLEKANTVLYIVAVFIGLIFAKTLYEVLTTVSFTMLILAAVFYLIGIIFDNL